MKRITIIVFSALGALTLFAFLFRLLRKRHSQQVMESEGCESFTVI